MYEVANQLHLWRHAEFLRLSDGDIGANEDFASIVSVIKRDDIRGSFMAEEFRIERSHFLWADEVRRYFARTIWKEPA